MINYNNPYMQYQQPRNNGINWVQGIEGAKAFQLMPSSNVMLLDSENEGIFYIKISDSVGMCQLRTFKYEEVQNAPSQLDTSNYITRAEFEQIKSEMSKLNERFNNEQFVSAVTPMQQ